MEHTERRRTGALIKNISCWGNRGSAAQTLERLPVLLPQQRIPICPESEELPSTSASCNQPRGWRRRTEIGSDCLELFRDGSRRYDTICQSPWRGDKRFAKSHRVCSQASKLLWGLFVFFLTGNLFTEPGRKSAVVSSITSAKLQSRSHSKRRWRARR